VKFISQCCNVGFWIGTTSIVGLAYCHVVDRRGLFCFEAFFVQDVII